MTRLNETGNYSCVATNEAGIDKREFSVTVVDCRNLCFNHGNVTNGQVENKVWCNASSSSVDIFKCLPTTATILDIRNNKIKKLQEDVFADYSACKNYSYPEIRYIN